ncbi:probable serine/threonine-protein kinase clkA [Malaya genurostris]|uniref:probable serine/threonine-protein kinase clkA n=1 Tax=Malaya genurostris TaxID=325434 RepID=UPI0026F3E2D5|nr:probable serine/threonine-protein kinase clkA [Malaya genurostris]
MKIMSSSKVILCLIGLQLVAAQTYANSYPYSTAIITESKLLKGISGKTSNQGGKNLRDFNRDHVYDEGGKINSGADAVRYHALDNQLNGHRIADSSKGGSVDKVKLLTGENFEADKSHNRKQVKSGFSNSYHKDENGSKTSYYEDSDDRGGKQVFDNRQNVRNNYNDHLYDKELRNDQLRDRHDDRYGGTELRGIRDYHHQAAADRGNLHDYRNGFRDEQDHHIDEYGIEFYPGLPPLIPVRNSDDLFQRRSYYEPRPMFATGSHRSGPITVYEDPREYLYDHRHPPTNNRRDGTLFRRFDDDLAERTRIIFRPSPLLNYRRY